MNAEAIADRLGTATEHERRSDGEWLTVPDLNVRAMARLMLDNESRFITLTAIPEDEAYRFVYHWDVEGIVLNVTTRVVDGRATSMADIWPAADWVEREVRDYYALEFEGRAETPTLMLRAGDRPGLFSRTSEMGRDKDPADTGWSDAPDAPKEEDR